MKPFGEIVTYGLILVLMAIVVLTVYYNTIGR